MLYKKINVALIFELIVSTQITCTIDETIIASLDLRSIYCFSHSQMHVNHHATAALVLGVALIICACRVYIDLFSTYESPFWVLL
jgi:hypothetical protein